mmetsp:Transcript_17574/g.40866  ORF Transcript_17574/g.40866 Transcript_17574/m.40866 type:complete len:225 (-) Transcript_17574:117-791(-)|eukprot:CAMPEP_0178431236 /NCGR_PEP_ID=MMETSP0689_2-20121128/31739_1 /TAXON_ID=160604 /ORGANISM="Amphidinium massartii, Strain CS-259" /LENGTH=224 /DNA_ID=CAMNT_0020053133 /DNA_START=73 /DNA_END=747 /DNA_ORIENTATION=-
MGAAVATCCVSRDTDVDVEPAYLAPKPHPKKQPPVLDGHAIKPEILATPRPYLEHPYDEDTEVPPSPAPSHASSGWSGSRDFFSPLLTARSPLPTSRSLLANENAEWPGAAVAGMLQRVLQYFPVPDDPSATKASANAGGLECASEECGLHGALAASAGRVDMTSTGAKGAGSCTRRHEQSGGLEDVSEAEDEDGHEELMERASTWAADRGLTVDGVEDLYRYF